MHNDWRPDISDTSVLFQLKPRDAPYFKIIEYCRHIGVHVRHGGSAFWVARVRTKSGGYRQKRLCMALDRGSLATDYADARMQADLWFETPSVAKIASEPYPLGSNRCLIICPLGSDYSVGHALQDYLDWKSLAATRSHYETLVSLINYHIVPRLAHVRLVDFDGKAFQKLARDILETTPKYGRNSKTLRVEIKSLTQPQLRKRKKTVNAIVSILRGAFELAWENGYIESDRPIRCLRRLPNAERPRVVFLDAVEQARLLDACDADLRLLVKAAQYTGCRANELIQMQNADYLHGSKAVYVSSPKGHRARHVLLPDVASAFFLKLSAGKAGTERLIRKSNGRTWGSEYKTYFQRAREKAGLGREVTFHGLRHTYASQLLQGGASILTVADQLGHANTQTVSQTYGHLTSTKKRDEIEACFSNDNFVHSRHSSHGADEVPVFKHCSGSSWPRANHSRFSGPLLSELGLGRDCREASSS